MKKSDLWTSTKDAVELYISTMLDDRLAAASEIHPRYELLWSRLKEISLTGGKRLRPYLTMVGFGEFSKDVVPVAAAQELLHIATLMHDDIIDQDLVRHGKPNLSGLYDLEYRQILDESQSRHYADSSALIGGDLLISEAYYAISQSSFEMAKKTRLTERLHRSIYEVVGGELLDVESAFLDKEIINPVTVATYKTAGYSFVGPLIAGAICAGSDESVQEVLKVYGLNLGIAFQLQDDLLGIFGNGSVTGKSTETDLREAKATVLIDQHKKLMDEKMQQNFSKYFGNQAATTAELDLLKQDIENSGAKQKVQDQIEQYSGKALKSVSSLPQADELMLFCQLLVRRSE